MSYIKDQLLSLEDEKLVKLHNKVADKDINIKFIYIFSEDGINDFLATPWDFYNNAHLFENAKVGMGDLFAEKGNDSIERITISELYDDKNGPVAYEAIEKALREDAELAKEFNITVEEYETHEIIPFIENYLNMLDDTELEEIAETLMSKLGREGKAVGDFVYLQQ